MASLLNTRSIYYDDVNLIAQPQKGLWTEDYSRQSRKQVPQELNRIIVSPMSSVVGETFAKKALELGLTVCLPRLTKNKNFQKEFLENNKELVKSCGARLYVSVGYNDYKLAKELNHPNILIDVANGYLSSVVSFQQRLFAEGYNVMCGNVHSLDGFSRYNKGTIVRVGIGQGSVCHTRLATGYTRGQITELLDCHSFRSSSLSPFICADGGIKYSGDIVKAFGAGADCVMIGGMLKNAQEAQNILDGDYSYWGGASHKQQEMVYGEIRRHSEGGVVSVDKSSIRPLKDIVDDIWGGIESGVSYSGYSSVSDFIGNGVFEIKK
jgi:coenzyme F420-reducing hydrogenase delta subunit